MTTLTYTPRKTVDYDLGKRCYIPGYVLTDECPKCGAVCTIDFALAWPEVLRARLVQAP